MMKKKIAVSFSTPLLVCRLLLFPADLPPPLEHFRARDEEELGTTNQRILPFPNELLDQPNTPKSYAPFRIQPQNQDHN